MDENGLSLTTLPAGSEVEVGSLQRKSGKVWLPIILSTGQKAYLPGETKRFVIQEGALMQESVEMHADPSARSVVKQKLLRNAKLFIMEKNKGVDGEWVKVRDMNGIEGYVSGDTRLRVKPMLTKASGMRNIRSGVMWIIAALIIFFSGNTPPTGSVYSLFGYAAFVFGAIMIIAGWLQYRRAPL